LREFLDRYDQQSGLEGRDDHDVERHRVRHREPAPHPPVEHHPTTAIDPRAAAIGEAAEVRRRGTDRAEPHRRGEPAATTTDSEPSSSNRRRPRCNRPRRIGTPAGTNDAPDGDDSCAAALTRSSARRSGGTGPRADMTTQHWSRHAAKRGHRSDTDFVGSDPPQPTNLVSEGRV
jgi:hypothetical protein